MRHSRGCEYKQLEDSFHKTISRSGQHLSVSSLLVDVYKGMALSGRFSVARVLLIGSVTLLVAAAFVFGGKTANSASGGCTTKSAQPLVSPDGAFSAIVKQNACEAGYAFTGTANYVVEVVSQTDSTKHMLVFSTEDSGYSDQRPVLNWLAPESLQIRALSPADVGVQKTVYSTVKISYKFTRP